MKVYEIQSIIRIMINVGENLKKYMIGVLLEMIICAIPVHVTLNIIRQVNSMGI